MDRRILVAIALLVAASTALVVWWFVRPQTPGNSGVPADHWEWTGTCYVAIGSPTTQPPGKVCVSTTNTVSECHYNNQTYTVGERFGAIDGCNTCTCDADTRGVICTDMACVNSNAQ